MRIFKQKCMLYCCASPLNHTPYNTNLFDCWRSRYFIYIFLFTRHDVVTFPVNSTHSGHSFAFLVLIFWALQIVTGFLLLGLISYVLDLQFETLLKISCDGNYVWLLRSCHMLGANFCIFALFLHFGKSISYSKILNTNKFILWLTGSFIFLLSLGGAFTGYVLVSGNMSFWAALVILNIFTVIPLLGEELVFALLGGSTVNSWSLRRFTFLHFLIIIFALLILIVHLLVLHRSNPSKTASDISDGSEFLIGVLIKDLPIGLVAVILIFIQSSRSFIHPDNWQNFSRLSTPEHIEPEMYFLWTFSIIKLHNSKVLGFSIRLNSWAVLGLGFATIAAIQFLDQLSATIFETGITK